MVVPMSNIVAFIQTAAADKHPVGSIGESPEYERHIHSSAAHYANQLDVCCILLSGDSSQIGGAVRSPIANETKDSRLEIKP